MMQRDLSGWAAAFLLVLSRLVRFVSHRTVACLLQCSNSLSVVHKRLEALVTVMGRCSHVFVFVRSTPRRPRSAITGEGTGLSAARVLG